MTMPDLALIISRLQVLQTWCAVNPRYGLGLNTEDCGKAVGWLGDALELLKALDDAGYPYCPHCGAKIKGDWDAED